MKNKVVKKLGAALLVSVMVRCGKQCGREQCSGKQHCRKQ